MDEIYKLFENPKAQTALRNMAIAGGASGVGGALLSAARKRKPTEDDGERRSRILRDGVLAAALGAGATGAASYGMDQFHNALPMDDTSPGEAFLNKPGTRGTMALIGGGLGHRYVTSNKVNRKAQLLYSMLSDAGYAPAGKTTAIPGIQGLAGSSKTLRDYISSSAGKGRMSGPSQIKVDLARAGYNVPGLPKPKALGRTLKANWPTMAIAALSAASPEIVGKMFGEGKNQTKHLFED